MLGTRVLLFGSGFAAATLIAFFVGRASVKGPEPASEEPQRLQPPRLSALPGARGRQSDPRPRDPAQVGLDLTDANISPPGSLEFLTAELFDEGDVAEFIVAWLETDPDGAIAWLASSEDRTEAFELIFRIWGSANLEAAEAWLAANAGIDEFQHAALGMALSLANRHPPERALQWFASVSDPLAIARFWGSVDPGLYVKSPELITERLAASGLPDHARSALHARWEIARYGDYAKRGAQNLASVYSSAVAAGAIFESDTPEELVRELSEGINGADSFSTTRFQVPNMSAAEIEAALAYLDGTDGSLSYTSRPAGRTGDP
ncbi:MAG: hypothetical protein ACR2RV_20220, partial [Verrucomicrobiales bacterium]